MSSSDALRSLTQDMASAQEETTRRVAEIKKETADLLRGFDKEQKKMGTQLRAELSKVKPDLAKGEVERKKASQAERRQRAGRVSEIKKETGDLLRGFDKAHSEMSAQLKSELVRAEDERKKTSQAEAKDRAAEVSRIRSETRELVEGFRRDSAETAAAWRELVTTMQAKRGVAVAPPPVKPPEVVEEEMPVEEVDPEEKVRLENRIVDLIREHPEGIRLTGIAEATGEARVKVGNITRMLVDEGKIKKEGLLYFPV